MLVFTGFCLTHLLYCSVDGGLWILNDTVVNRFLLSCACLLCRLYAPHYINTFLTFFCKASARSVCDSNTRSPGSLLISPLLKGKCAGLEEVWLPLKQHAKDRSTACVGSSPLSQQHRQWECRRLRWDCAKYNRIFMFHHGRERERESPPFLQPRRGPTPDKNCNGNHFGASFGVLEGWFRIGFTVFADCFHTESEC